MRIDPRIKINETLPTTDLPVSPLAPQPQTRTGETSSPVLSRLTNALRQVNELQQTADVEAEKLATGKADNVQDVVVALEQADLALQLTVQVTQKVVDAYREVSRMQV
jgi:flagellar hook-basal body complex protein FliE